MSCGDVSVGGDQGKKGEEEREWKRKGGDGGRVQGRHDTAGWLGRSVCRKRKQQGRRGRGRDGEGWGSFVCLRPGPNNLDSKEQKDASLPY